MADVVLKRSKEGKKSNKIKPSKNQKRYLETTLDLTIDHLKSSDTHGNTGLTYELVEEQNNKNIFNLTARIELLEQSVSQWGSLTQSSPIKTIGRTFNRLNFKKLSEIEKNGTIWALLGELDTALIEPLETGISFSAPKHMHQVYPILAEKNLVGFDGASIAIRTSSFSIVYARAGSYGYSQRLIESERLSFNGINRIWCDIAPIIPFVPNSLVTDDGLKQLMIEDFEKKYKGPDKILMAEIEAQAQVESLAVILCVKAYEKLIDLILIDGPMYIAQDGFESSLTRAQYLKKTAIPHFSIVKNLIASPVMGAAGQKKNWTDFAFFATSLQPGDRSCAFLRHDEGKFVISDPALKRVFFYYKTLQGDLFRYELPLWVWEQEKDQKSLLDCCIADSLLAGGGFSFVCKKADQFVRIRKNLRLLLRSSYFTRLKDENIELSEPYNQKRWGV